MEKGSLDLLTLEDEDNAPEEEEDLTTYEEEKYDDQEEGKALYDKSLFANEIIEDEEVDFD